MARASPLSQTPNWMALKPAAEAQQRQELLKKWSLEILCVSACQNAA